MSKVPEHTAESAYADPLENPSAQRVASIYRRVFRGSLLAVALGLVLSALLAYLSTRHEVGELFDAQLIENTRVLKGLINHPATAKDWQGLQASLQETLADQVDQHSLMADGHAYEKNLAVQVWTPDGQLIVRSPSAPAHALAPLKVGFHHLDGNAHDWQVYTVWLEHNQHWLTVAERSDIRQELSLNIEASLLLGVLLGLGLAIWILRRELKRGLTPLFELGQAIRGRHAKDLNPIKLNDSAQEIEPVIDELNLLFDRVNTGMARERRFLADAAHELRTPLSVIRLQVQQALSKPASEQHTYLQRLLHSVDRNQQVVEQLLQLARLDSDLAEFEPVMTSLDELVRETVAQMIPLAMQREIELIPQTGRIQARVEPAMIVVLIRNLIDNALRHAPTGSVIDLTLSQVEQQIILTVADHGSGIHPDLIGQMTERFRQGSSADTGSSGLGLAIAQTIVQRHSGSLYLNNRPEGGLMVEVYLPYQPIDD